MTKKLKKIIFATSGVLLGCGILAGSIAPTLLSHHNKPIYNTITKITNSSLNAANTGLSNANNVTIDNLNYTIDPSTLDATLNGYESKPKTFTPLNIPSYITYNGIDYTVSSISNGAFMNSNLSAVSFPSTILSIGNLSFANNYLTSLTLPANLSSIGQNAFSNNMFNYGTRVFLPTNCTWNKKYGTSSFDTSNNYSVFSPCVQFVIQGSAVYTYNPVQGGYVITSYMPNQIYQQEKSSIPTITNNAWEVSKIYGTSDNSNSTTYSSSNTNESVGNQPVLLTSLKETALSFNGLGSNSTSDIITFDPSTMKINYQIYNGDGTNGVYMSGGGTTFGVSMYDPNNNSYIIPQTAEPGWQSNKNFGTLWQGKSFAYGDIITFTIPNSWINPRNSTSGLFNISTNYYQGINPSDLNGMYLYNRGWSENRYDTASFRITPLGLIPYVNTTTISNNSLNVITPNFSGDFNITGNTSPNATVYATINDTTYSAIASNTGTFSIPITNQKDLTVNSQVSLYSSSSSPYYLHFEGANPNGTVFIFGINNSNTIGITFDGLTNSLTTWYQNSNRYFADYETPWDVSQTSTLSSSTSTFNAGSTIVFNMTYNENGKVTTKSTTINFEEVQTVAQLNSVLATIPIQNLTKVNVQCHNVSLNYLFSNQRQQEIGYDFVGQSSNYLFNYSIADGLTNQIIPRYKNGSIIWNQTTNTWLGVSSSPQYAMTPWSIYGGYSNGWNAKYYFGVYHTINGIKGDYSYQIGSNWYDPTPKMYEFAHSLISGITNPVTQAVQIVRWAYDNFGYNNEAAQEDYAVSASQSFNMQSGICGDYSALSACLLSLDGFVARIITGNTAGPTLFNQDNSIDHAWIQVWISMYGEWVTLDPTWGWYGNPGNNGSLFSLIRTSETVTNYVFPPYNPSNPNTLFSSYFTNYPWQELNYFGNYYGIPDGQSGFKQSPYTVAAIASLFNNQASLMKDTDYMSVNGFSNKNNFWVITPKTSYSLDGNYGY